MKPGKTAGTSVLRGFLELEIPDILQHDGVHKDQHDKQRKMEGYVVDWLNGITDEELEDYYIFTTVRNPWSRAVSLGSYFGVGPEKYLDNMQSYEDSDSIFAQHALPQHVYTHMNGEQFVDRVVKMENIYEDFDLVLSDIGLNTNRKLPHNNKSNHKDYKQYYNDKRKNIVGDKYKLDIEYYGYRF